MKVDLSKEESQTIILILRATVDFLENIDTERVYELVNKLENFHQKAD